MYINRKDTFNYDNKVGRFIGLKDQHFERTLVQIQMNRLFFFCRLIKLSNTSAPYPVTPIIFQNVF